MTRLKAPKGGCVVRAYRHGLGDCFLLAFANQGNQQRYVLIDCGVLLGTKDATATMNKVAKDIREATNDRLHALVLTHQHWDHISGFGQAVTEFDKIEADQLWVSWAENADDPVAKELLDRYGAALTSLQAADPLLGASKSPQAKWTREIMSFLGPLEPGSRWSTEKIMKKMLDEFSAKTRFCTPGDEPHRISGLPGVSFFVLGPPRDVNFIRKSSPSQGDVYMANPRIGASASLMSAVEARKSSSKNACWTPFTDSYSAHYDDPATPLRQENLKTTKKLYGKEDWRNIKDDWLDGMSDLAIKLDSHLNNTSLALAIELEENGRVLLFPADAQVGNWRSWHKVKWRGRDGVTAEDLLNRTVCYKVGHHASHNATLGDKGLEMMTSPNLLAVIPLNRKMAKKKRWNMPYDKLFERLKTRTNNRTYITDDDADHPYVTRKTELYADFEFVPSPKT